MKCSWPQLLQIFSDYERVDHGETELSVERSPELYPELSSAALYTPAEDLRRIQCHPEISGTWVDLGAGHGLSVLTYLQLHPDREAFGIEKSAARVRAGRRIFSSLGVKTARLREEDLLKADLEGGETFFIYFPTGHVLDRVLAELQKLESFKLVAIESHGDLFPRLELEPGLTLVAEVELSVPRHHPKARIFRKAPERFQKETLFNRSFLREHVVIGEGEGCWLGETFGAEWIGGQRFNLCWPPRTIDSASIREFRQTQELAPELGLLTELRRRGEILVKTEQETLCGELRKIHLAPDFCLEFSGGQTVKWTDIREILHKGHRCYVSSFPSSFSLPAV